MFGRVESKRLEKKKRGKSRVVDKTECETCCGVMWYGLLR